MAKQYVVSYTNKDGEKVTGQLYTAQFLSSIVANLEEWGCTDIEIREVQDVMGRLRNEYPNVWSAIDTYNTFMANYIQNRRTERITELKIKVHAFTKALIDAGIISYTERLEIHKYIGA